MCIACGPSHSCPHTPAATHTITLHLDMTSLDISEVKACCKRHDLKKYRRLGMSVEEVVEVSMKLNALKALGIHLSINGEGRRGRRER